MINRRRMLIGSTSVDVANLIFSCTGVYTDELITIGDEQYRLLTFPYSCELTLDPRMVGAITFDAWVVGSGGNGGEGADSTSYHSVTGSTAGFYELGGPYHGVSIGCSIISTSASGGGAGGAGGWAQLADHIAQYNKLVIKSGWGNNSISENSEVLVAANAGGDAFGTSNGADSTRTGPAWFTTPYGAGGAQGDPDVHKACTTHGTDMGGAHGEDGDTGQAGVVYVRIPLQQ